MRAPNLCSREKWIIVFCLTAISVGADFKLSCSLAAPAPPSQKQTGADSGSLTDKAAGAKSTAALVKKLNDAYTAHDGNAYLKLVQAPVRQRMRMEIQFVRDAHNVARNFKFLTVAEEKKRTGSSAKIADDNKNGSDKAAYNLPLVGYIDFDLKSSPDASPLVVGVPVGESKGQFFIVCKVSPAKTTP